MEPLSKYCKKAEDEGEVRKYNKRGEHVQSTLYISIALSQGNPL
jgi:hypothetical protein